MFDIVDFFLFFCFFFIYIYIDFRPTISVSNDRIFYHQTNQFLVYMRIDPQISNLTIKNFTN